MRYLSPLRYPGGKARLAPFIGALVRAQDPVPTRYAEPYAGGAGAALRLLADGVVSHVHVNDANPGLAAFWRTVTDPEGAESLCRLIDQVPVSVDQWHHQRAVYQDGQADDLTLGFATFYLNRTNRSGILGAWPIGGLEQTGRWKIDARYNKDGLIRRVRAVASMGDRIHVTELDGVEHLRRMGTYGDDVLVYADPPYVEQGDRLYTRTFDAESHRALAGALSSSPFSWLVTYDDHRDVWGGLYADRRCERFSFAHTAAVQHVGKETLVYGPGLVVPGDLEVTPGVRARRIDPGTIGA